MTNANGVMLFTDEDKAYPSFPYAVHKAVDEELRDHDITLTEMSLHGFSVCKRKLTVVASCGSFELGVEDGD